ncbi:MAG: NnrS family protein [Chloroflexi bacterium]|nr:NnrS family protein [Chloroflexota bacterium]
MKQLPQVYRPFIIAAIVIALTAGGGLGAINLAAMAVGGAVGTTWLAITQAHGHAQIFGWVGMFIMGVVYYVVPRLKGRELKSPGLVAASLWLVLGGIVLRLIAQPLSDGVPFGHLVVLSAAMELVGVSFFVYLSLNLLTTDAQARAFYDKYLAASLVWFWILTAATLTISVYSLSLGIQVIPYAVNAAYLQIGLMGFVGMMIYGMALRTLPLFMGLRAPNQRAFDIIFVFLNVSVIARALVMLAADALDIQLAPWLPLTVSALEYGSILAFVWFLNVFRKPEINIAETGVDQGYEKYIRAAFVWLLLAVTMSFGYSVYRFVTGADVDSAYIGAYRHALTVGFISLMILGMASRLVPVFAGDKLHSSRLLNATFILVNAGNVMRVLSEPLAREFGGVFFVTMGISGFIQLAGLALFGYNIWQTMRLIELVAPKEAATSSKADDSGHSPRMELPLSRRPATGRSSAKTLQS